ncbi:proteasome assembly chaperone family protein [Candidatus Woesearchaeota archaeon]|nr:proteasome assembly chaperone family protein [Candidatus Woesearchaeota archaeon]
MLNITKNIKGKVIIAGFPGFGLVGTIATGYLAEHLKAEKIGTAWFEELPATIAIHESKVVHPISFYHAKKYGIIIAHGITGNSGVEWKIAGILRELAKKTGVKKIVTIEGVGSQNPEPEARAYYYTSEEKEKKKIEKTGCQQLREGIIMGVTSALMIQPPEQITTIFTEAHAQIPDSKAAAKVIEILDKYMGLGVDYKPLIQEAEKFEQKLKSIMKQGVQAQKKMDDEQESYIG